MAKKLKRGKSKPVKKSKFNLKKLTAPPIQIVMEGTTGSGATAIFKTPEQMFKEALINASEWQNNVTLEEKSKLTYHELRMKSINRTFESFKHILKKKIK